MDKAMDVQSGFAGVNGARLYYEVAGAGQPLVLLHGFSLDCRMWDDQFEPFARRYRVVRYDLRGFGRSAPPTDQLYSHTADLKALLAHLGIGQTHIMGLSLGGGQAVDFAIAYPQAVDRLIVIGAAVGGHRWSKEWDETIIPIWDRGRNGDVAAAKALWRVHPLFTPILERPQAAARLTRIVDDYSGWHWRHDDPGRGLDPPAMGRLGEVQARTLILIGERDLPDFHLIADRLGGAIPQARKIVLSGVGHMTNMEAPERVNENVLQFLQEAL